MTFFDRNIANRVSTRALLGECDDGLLPGFGEVYRGLTAETITNYGWQDGPNFGGASTDVLTRILSDVVRAPDLYSADRFSEFKTTTAVWNGGQGYYFGDYNNVDIVNHSNVLFSPDQFYAEQDTSKSTSSGHLVVFGPMEVGQNNWSNTANGSVMWSNPYSAGSQNWSSLSSGTSTNWWNGGISGSDSSGSALNLSETHAIIGQLSVDTYTFDASSFHNSSLTAPDLGFNSSNRQWENDSRTLQITSGYGEVTADFHEVRTVGSGFDWSLGAYHEEGSTVTTTTTDLHRSLGIGNPMALGGGSGDWNGMKG